MTLMKRFLQAAAVLQLAIAAPVASAADGPAENQMCAGMMSAMTTVLANNLVEMRGTDFALSAAHGERITNLSRALITAGVALAPNPAKPSEIDEASRDFSKIVVTAVNQANTGKRITTKNAQLPNLIRDVKTCSERFSKPMDFAAIDDSGIFMHLVSEMNLD